MEVDTIVLDILFRKMSPGQILERLRGWGSVVNFEQDRQMFQQYAPMDLDGYSLDEHKLIFDRLHTEAARLEMQQQRNILSHGRLIDEDKCVSKSMPLPDLAFYSVLDFSKRVLKQQANMPVCRIEHVLPWREAYLLLGQDLFVCAYLAASDLENRVKCTDFTWPAVIRTDHPGLNDLLNRGVAENHQHLYGSSQTFALSWCSLMNYPSSHKEIGKDFDELYQPFSSRSTGDHLVSTKERVRYAALCRNHLFRRLHDLKPEWDWLDALCPELRCAQELRNLRILYGTRVPQLRGKPEVLDYALEEHIFQAAPDAAYRSLAGERSFLYSCFREFLLGSLTEREEMLFYFYLVLKALFRSELIQVNRQVGFHNFAKYQDRKTLLCDTSFYFAELMRMALNAPLHEGNVTSLETRVVPKADPQKNMDRLIEADDLYRFGNFSLAELQDPCRSMFTPITRENFLGKNYFFVFHFVKLFDKPAHTIQELDLVCRHQKLRGVIRGQAVALAKNLSRSEYFCQRMRGIDAANHEFGCPPEVFATAFRFIRHFRTSDYVKAAGMSKVPIHRISATYHAGEDFLDIVGALRAIDDAVILLEMERGDRIGHALGLGVDPGVHYSLKRNHVFMRRQERLDDLVWIIFRGVELGAEIEHLQSLKEEARDLIKEIYGDAIRENNWHISLEDYNDVMQLRGDSPERYATMKYEAYTGLGDSYDDFSISKRNSRLEKIRANPALAGLYYYYHYGRRERIRGEKIIEVDVDAKYIRMVRCLQTMLQKDLAHKGIAIESNPSSNVLIGTFGRYDLHPIFRFNNTDLERDPQKYSACPQLLVCVNTDDLGVFDTSQEFEYALLFHALCQITDEKGNVVYKENDILHYLENLRKMGHAVVFPPNTILAAKSR